MSLVLKRLFLFRLSLSIIFQAHPAQPKVSVSAKSSSFGRLVCCAGWMVSCLSIPYHLLIICRRLIGGILKRNILNEINLGTLVSGIILKIDRFLLY